MDLFPTLYEPLPARFCLLSRSYGLVVEWITVTSTLRIDSPHFRVRQDHVRLPSGAHVDDYYVWESPSIATIVPHTESGDFVLVRQWRHELNSMLVNTEVQVGDSVTAGLLALQHIANCQVTNRCENWTG